MAIDAEDAERLELSLDVFGRARRDPSLAGWEGVGLAVQAYQERGQAVVRWIAALADDTRHRIPVRLVKGAYWDTEIKRAQVQGLSGYPVFTRKTHTDISYLACASAMLEAGSLLYPMFATHNAHTIAWVLARARARGIVELEFQRLHGMGEALYAQVLADSRDDPCRVYAPVGSHQDLLPYLVRRLLENGANTSFVNRIADPAVSIDDVVADPVERARAWNFAPAMTLPLPIDLYGAERRNSLGVSLADQDAMAALDAALVDAAKREFIATPMMPGATSTGTAREMLDPADRRVRIGTVVEADSATVDRALTILVKGQPSWDAL